MVRWIMGRVWTRLNYVGLREDLLPPSSQVAQDFRLLTLVAAWRRGRRKGRMIAARVWCLPIHLTGDDARIEIVISHSV